jgi:hypothetical protein
MPGGMESAEGLSLNFLAYEGKVFDTSNYSPSVFPKFSAHVYFRNESQI